MLYFVLSPEKQGGGVETKFLNIWDSIQGLQPAPET